MVERFNKKDLEDVLDLLSTWNRESTFYYTNNNKRVYVTTKKDLLILLADSTNVFVTRNEREEINGIILIWRGKSDKINRRYVKYFMFDSKSLDSLLIILGWNYNNKEDLFVKLNKKSQFVRVFNNKGFRFFHDRGKEILLRRQNNGSKPFKYRNKSEESDRG